MSEQRVTSDKAPALVKRLARGRRIYMHVQHPCFRADGKGLVHVNGVVRLSLNDALAWIDSAHTSMEAARGFQALITVTVSADNKRLFIR